MAAVTYQRVSRCLSFFNRAHLYRRSHAFCTDTTGHADSAHQDEHRSQEETDDDPQTTKLRILDTAIAHQVHQHGWTRRSLQEAATSLGMPSVVHGLFPHGGFDLVNHFYRSSTARLAADLAEEPRHPTSAFVRRALQTRLHMVTPHVDTWPQAMALQALPQHVPTSLANLAALVDEIWFLAGDNSIDMSWYTKRLELAAVYKSCELFLLQDRSPSFADTWAFMDRRLHDVTASGVRLGSLLSASASARELFTGLGLIARNVTRM